MATRDLVVVGASAGGVEALKLLVAGLPADLPAAILVCVHIPATAESFLARILARNGNLPATAADHGEKWERGHIYVARPDQHLLTFGERLRCARGPRVNGHRPAIDPMFRAAARQHGPRVIGVVLSGVLDDGTAGMVAIKQHGGVAVVQSPSDALYPAMPESVLDHVAVDHQATASGIAELLSVLTREEIEIDIRERGDGDMPTNELELEERNEEELQGPPTMFTCPECSGSLWEISDAEALRYRCHVGHAYGPESLFAGQSEALEEAMWTAYRALRESAMLAKRLGDRARAQNLPDVAHQYEERQAEAWARAELVRGVLERGQLLAAAGRKTPREA